MKLNSKEVGIWFMSDPHYGHKNICKGTTSWENKEGCRDFDTISKMNDVLVSNINAKVHPNDVLFCLGDWSFGGIDNIWNFRSRLNVKTLHFITGNHDYHIETNRLLQNCAKQSGLIYTSISYTQGLNFSLPVENLVSAKDLFTSVQHYLRLGIDGQEIVMSHYPMAAWEHSYKGSWMLHGHCHGTLFTHEKQWAGNGHWYTSSKILDVGIDNINTLLGDYRPISFQEIRTIMNKRTIIFNDHHDQNTMG